MYVQRMRSLGAQGGDSAAFLEAIRSIEDEVKRVKAMYESELEALRYVELSPHVALICYIFCYYPFSGTTCACDRDYSPNPFQFLLGLCLHYSGGIVVCRLSYLPISP